MKIEKEKYSEIVVALVMAIIPLYCLYEMATKFVEKNIHTGGAESNAALFPRILSVGLLILLFIHICSVVLSKNRENIYQITVKNKKRLISVFISLVSYIFLLPIIGFYIISPIFLFVCLRITGEKHIIKSIIFSIVASVVVGGFFSQVMNLILPSGIINIF